jgi:hypothetical protein
MDAIMIYVSTCMSQSGERNFNVWIPNSSNFESNSIAASRDSAVGIAARYELDGREFGFRVPVGLIVFSSPRRPHRLYGSHSLPSSRYWRPFPEGKAAGT